MGSTMNKFHPLNTADTSRFGTLLPVREHFRGPSRSLGNEKSVNLPRLALPSRQCITSEKSRSVDVEEYSSYLQNFAANLFATSVDDGWQDISLKRSMFRSVTRNDEVNEKTVRIWRYPSEKLDQESFRGLPLFRVEYTFESVKSPDVALQQMRTMYFDPTYIDDESEYFLVEKLPTFKNSSLEAGTVFRALWNPKTGFATRDWLEYIFIDKETKTLVSRSCFHPDHLEYNEYASKLQRIATNVCPGVGLVRAGAFYCVKFSPTKQGTTGAVLQMLCWYSMRGVPDCLLRLGVPHIEHEYIVSILRGLNQWTHVNECPNERGDKTPPFDLL